MATLTADQITYIRANTGDATFPADSYLQYLYDNQASSDLDTTVYYALLAIYAQDKQKTSRSNNRTGDSKSENQYLDNLEDLIKMWAMKTGANIATATLGVLNLGIDEEDQTRTNP